jgi:hypothetical protein
LILELIDFDSRVVGADLVVTGEGSLDDQSLAGKAPIGLARARSKIRCTGRRNRRSVTAESATAAPGRNLRRVRTDRSRARSRPVHRELELTVASTRSQHCEGMARPASQKLNRRFPDFLHKVAGRTPV